MTRTVEIASNAAASSWTDITSVLPWRDMRIGGMAHNLEVGTGSGFNLDDDAGTRTLPVKRVMRVIEDATSPDTTLFRGRVSDKGLARGTRWFGDAKAFDTSLDDNNSAVFGIPVDGWSRPSETDYARIQALGDAFLAGSPRTSTNLNYSTYVPNTHTVTLPAKTYDATDVGGVIRDCGTSAGKQSFVTVDDELFYDQDVSTAYAATLSITDSSPNLSTSFPPGEPRGSEQGNEFFSGATLRYGNHLAVSDVRSSAETAHDYWRTVFYDGDAKASTAAQRLATMLDNQSIEELTYTCTLRLLDTQVDKIKYGHTVSFRSAAAGVLSPVTLRVASLYWEPVSPGVYLAHLELGVPQKIAPKVRKGSPPADQPPFVCTPTDFKVHFAGGAEVMACVFSGHGNGQSCQSPDTSGGDGDMMYVYNGATYRIDYLVFHAADSNELSATLKRYGGSALGTTGAPVVGTGSAPQVYMGDHARHCQLDPTPDDIPAASSTWTADFTGFVQAMLIEGACAAGDSYASSISAHITYLSGPDPRFESLGPCTNGTPSSGQEVQDPAGTGDGTTTSYTTVGPLPYAPHSLHVEVGGVDWTAAVTETDPTTGTYALAYAPPLGATLRIWFSAP